MQIDSMREELARKETEMAALKTKLEAQVQQQSDYQKHISVLKESISAKDEQIGVLQSDVSPVRFEDRTARHPLGSCRRFC